MTNDDDLSALLQGPYDLGRLRVLAGRLGLPPDTYSHLSHDAEVKKLAGYVVGLLDSLDDRGMTIDSYLAVVDGRAVGVTRLPVTPIARGRRGLRLRRFK